MRVIYRNPNYISDIDKGVNLLSISFFNDELSIIKEVDLRKLNWDEEYNLFKLDFESENQIIAHLQLSDEDYIYIYTKDSQVYLSREGNISRLEFDNQLLKVENERNDLKILQMGKALFEIRYKNEKNEEVLLEINDLLSNNVKNIWIDLEIADTSSKKKTTLSSIELNGIYLFITYYPSRKQINISNVFVKNLDLRISNVTILNRKEVKLNIDNRKLILPFRKTTPPVLIGKNKNLLHPNEKIKISINQRQFYLYVKNNQIYLSHDRFEVYGIHVNLRASFWFNKLFIFGKYFNSGKSEFASYDYIYIKNTDKPIGKFKRLNIFGKGKVWGYASIDLNTLTQDTALHRSLAFGVEDTPINPLFMRRGISILKTFSRKKHGNNILILRGNISGGTSFTSIPYSQEYSIINTLKTIVAKYCAKVIVSRKNVNLYFEKRSSKADESSIRVFKRVMEVENLKSTNLFILDKTSDAYSELKKRYKKNLVAKYSFKHFYSIFQADYFISSELSANVINNKSVSNRFRSKVTTTPLIFLQHGIMFAKPIDNPKAKAFHKKNLSCNIQKTVISSELEAEQFYKVGYDKNDLLLTGLSTFDYAKLLPDADKIAYMPTYRYWEEHLVYNGNVEETSYYQDLLQMIHLFEENNMLDRLLIVPHNGFSPYFGDNFKNYSENICLNPSEALRKAKVFITDYSSAIYDAIIRGAYPIFYWEAKDYLIENYKAIPPVNDENAPGQIAYSKEALMKIVKNAINNDYQLEEDYLQKYRKINQFSDGKNTDRIVDYLISDNII